MNKIKLMYDVITVLKEKEIFKGTLNVEARKDQEKVFTMVKEFEKNTVTGDVKSKVSTALDYEGKQVKHQSSTEFNRQDCCGEGHANFIKHIHQRHKHPKEGCGMKGKLAKIGLFLDILNKMKVEEQEDMGVVISIHMDELSGELKNIVKYKMDHKRVEKDQQHPWECMEGCCPMENVNVDLTIRINKDHGIERVHFEAMGDKKDKENKIHPMEVQGELILIG